MRTATAVGKAARGMWLILTIALLVSAAGPARLPAQDGIREPAVAGRFYPEDGRKLRAALDAYREEARPPAGLRPAAIVAPHAGYVFSGQIAADAFHQAQSYNYDLIVILGTNHTSPGFSGVSIFDGRGYRTPLGVAPIDRTVVQRLLETGGDFSFRPDVHAREHSVEVQVPFVQYFFPEAKIVAAVVGSPDPGLCRRFAAALAEAVKDRRVLIVASSDLSHYPAYDDARAVDREVLESVATLDPDRIRTTIAAWMQKGIPGLSTCACGEAPILTAVIAARLLGAEDAAVVSYANSGDTALGESGRVVGYGAVVIGNTADGSAVDPPAAPPADPGAELLPEDKAWLLSFARRTIARYFETGTAPLARPESPALHARRGAFVTLKRHGRLRGCIGHMSDDAPLCKVVGAMALQAAFNDRRFQPLSPAELDQIEIEVSVLTPQRRIASPQEIVIGRDGVVLRKDGSSAVYLPQVALEQGWNRDEMLRHLCLKAGLPADAWRQGAELSTFQAAVFHEGEEP
ncbi:MAG: AmmeMemoRadiSam system protein B [Candidatus Eisenbacteria bacterium]|nr:AmmeMemoRadiSam system protein B [Candidatus Eisenbacteria bacterium]